MAVQTTIKIRRDIASNWSTQTLAAGEFGLDTTNKRLKIGDGSTVWSSLGYLKAGTATTLETARLINGVSFDGSADITITADATTITGTTLKSTVVNSSLTKVGALSAGTAGFVKVDASGNLTSDGSTYLTSSTIGSTVQGYDADLQAIGALAGTTGYLKKTAANTWALDSGTYLLSSAIGSTVQAWDADLDAIAALTATTGYLKKTAANTWALDGTVPLTSAAIGSTVQGWDADLDAIGALAGTAGILTKTAANTWSLDTNSYLQASTLSGSSTYIGTTAVSLARASANLALTGISSVTFPGSTSGTILLKATATAGSNTLTLPAITGNVFTDQGGTFAGSLTLRSGAASAGTAPVYFVSGSNLTTAAAGAMEFDGTSLYFTPVATRKTIAFTDSAMTGTVNGVTFTGTSGKTFTVQNNFTFAGTDGAGTFTFPASGGNVALTSSSITGNAATATKFASATTGKLNGVNYDGSAATVIPGAVLGAVGSTTYTTIYVHTSSPSSTTTGDVWISY